GAYAIGADGPAFHRARQALTEAKAERKAYAKAIVREVRLFSGSSLLDTVVDALFLALSALKKNWTEKQTLALNLLEQGGSPTQIAESLEIPVSNISRTVEASQYREYEFLADSLKTVLNSGYKKIINNNITKK
ncbi:MAG: hypothetical protein ACE5DO_12235, partial [Desulfobacterales bacterium]